MPEQSNYSICYEAIQRIYRNAVVRAARQKFEAKFPGEWGAKVRGLFTQDEWQRMVDDANEAWVIGFVDAPLADDLDYLGVNHFFNLYQKFFDYLFPKDPQAGERAFKKGKELVGQWQIQVQMLRNSISHPSEDDLPYLFAHAGLTNARLILGKIGEKAAANQITGLMGLLHDGSKPLAGPPVPGPGKPPIISAEQDVLVVPAGRYARDDYEKYHAYICQPNRAFRPVPRMAFYDHGVILPYVPTIQGVVESVSFSDRGYGDIERARLDSAAADKARKLLRTVLAEEGSWASRDRTQFKMVLLSGPDDREKTFLLLTPIVNDKRSKRGRPAAFVQAQRYVSFAKLQTHPKVTSQLE